MGAYLTQPVTEKISVDGSGAGIVYGGSCMQGWRVTQEDAHNCISDFDKDTHLFAVYDGHGGDEVAKYCAMNLPDFIKSSKAYKMGNLASALEEAFLGFDETLTKAEVIRELKVLANREDELIEDDEDKTNEAAKLYEEATMPLEKLLCRYGQAPPKNNVLGVNTPQFQSPALRGKKSLKTSNKIGDDNIKTCLMNGEGDHKVDGTSSSSVIQTTPEGDAAVIDSKCAVVDSTSATVKSPAQTGSLVEDVQEPKPSTEPADTRQSPKQDDCVETSQTHSMTEDTKEEDLSESSGLVECSVSSSSRQDVGEGSSHPSTSVRQSGQDEDEEDDEDFQIEDDDEGSGSEEEAEAEDDMWETDSDEEDDDTDDGMPDFAGGDEVAKAGFDIGLKGTLAYGH